MSVNYILSEVKLLLAGDHHTEDDHLPRHRPVLPGHHHLWLREAHESRGEGSFLRNKNFQKNMK